MHRQSLGSPSSNLHNHIHGGPKEDCLVVEESTRRRDSISSPRHADYDEDNDKSSKPHHSPPVVPVLKAEKLIHLIPIVIILCFFILFLFSRTPSHSDLAQFNGFKRAAKHLDTGVALELNGIMQYTAEVERSSGDTVAIRSLRNLREIAVKQSPKSRPHRKFAALEPA